MTYPAASCSANGPQPSSHLPGSTPAQASRAGAAGQRGGARPAGAPGSAEGDHELEKLEFALAVALTRGDQQRSHVLRERIAELGGNREEPGT
jgi:hypothetical protein